LTVPGRDDRDVERFERRADTYEHGWRAEFHARVVAATADVALQAVPSRSLSST
jgi:hypothetical protein